MAEAAVADGAAALVAEEFAAIGTMELVVGAYYGFVADGFPVVSFF